MTIKQLIDELSGLIDRGVSGNREVIYFYDDDAYTYQAGIDEYIHVRANCYQILQLLQKKKGMIA